MLPHDGVRDECVARDGIEAWEKALAWDPAIVVTDLKMPRMDGIGLLSKLAEEGTGLNANLAVVVLTAMGSIQLAVDAMKLGAYDYVTKPFPKEKILSVMRNALEKEQLLQENRALKHELGKPILQESIIFRSNAQFRVLRLKRSMRSGGVSELAETGSCTEDLCPHLSLSQSSLSRQCNSVSAIDRIRVLKSGLELLR